MKDIGFDMKLVLRYTDLPKPMDVLSLLHICARRCKKIDKAALVGYPKILKVVLLEAEQGD